MDKWEAQHRRDIALIEQQIKAIYEQAIKEATNIGISVENLTDTLFSFQNFPLTRERIERLLDGVKNNLNKVVVDGVNAQWTLANNKNNELVRRVLGDNFDKLNEAQIHKYFNNNDKARQAFLARKENGLTLSNRVWKYTDMFQTEIEMGLDIGIRQGMSADEISRILRAYLQHPDKLFRRVRDEHGDLVLSQAAKNFHPGQGVYRSSYMNARRLAATETNMAYRTADYERVQQFDFVVGIEVHLSNNHNCKGVPAGQYYDICDELQGKYPKDFKFTGWHPHCRCFTTTILKTKEEFEAGSKKLLNGEPVDRDSVNRIVDVPDRFNEWIEDNKERAKGWSLMPYFVRQNPQYVRGFEVDTYTSAERKFTRAFKTSPAMKESLGIFLQARYPSIPNTEKAAIFQFTRGDISAYRQLNNQLRKGNLSEFNMAFSELLSDGLSKIEPVEGIVFRSIRLNRTNLTAFIDNAQSGKITTFAGFTSTTTDRSIAEHRKDSLAPRKNNETDVLLIIKGKSGHPIEELSQFSGRFDGLINQHEVLFDKGCKFRFDRVIMKDGEMTVFYLTEVQS